MASGAGGSELLAWLTELGLEAYAQALAENDVDLELLGKLTAEDLREIGIASVGHRRRLLDAAARLNPPPLPAPVLPAPPLPAAVAAPRGAAQRRPITVLFCDLVGSTALSARLDPEDLRDHLNAFRNLLARRVQEHDGWIAQYLGDGVLAYFGYPSAHEHDAEQAISAALAIIDGLPSLPAPPGLAEHVAQVRIGVATGMTVVGATLVDDGEGAEPSAVGQAPNLAARAQAVAEPNTVVVSAETRQLIGGLFECRELGRFELKGFADRVPLWQVTRESPLASRFDALRAASHHALVGRDDEAARLMQRLAEARAGRGQIVVVTGEGGLGKSRLVGHVVEAADVPADQRLVFQCSPYHVSTPLHSVRYYLERASGIQAADAPGEALGKLASLFGGAVAPQSLVLLADLLRIKRDASPAFDAMESQEQRRRTMQLLSAELVAAARRVPLLVIEDLQWIDPSSAELFGRLFERLAELPLLVVATMRPGPLPGWVGEVRREIIALDRLDAASARALVQAVAAPHRLSEATVAAIVARSDGVPLYTEELTRACVERSAANGAAGDGTEGIPSTLVESLLARLDRFEQGRELALIAAVLGREMTVELLGAVCEGASSLNRAAVAKGIRELLDAGVFVHGHSRFGAAIAFRHMLVREAAYQLLVRRERQRLHAHAALTLETRFAAVAEALPHMVALHHGEGGDGTRAALWWERAGDDANQRSAYREAAAHYRRALELTAARAEGRERALREFELRKSLIGPLIAADGFQGVEVAREIAACVGLAERLGSEVSLVAVLALQWLWVGPGGDLKTSHQLSLRMREAAAGGTEVERLWAHRFLGTTFVFSGRFAEALAEYHAFLALYEPERHAKALTYVGPSNHHLMVLVGLAEVSAFYGQAGEATKWRERCLAVAREDGRSHNLCQALVFGACFTSALIGDHKTLAGHASELYALTHGEDERPVWRGHAELFEGLARVGHGRVEEGFALARSGIAQIRATASYSNVWYILYADACARAGLVGEAEASLEFARPTLEGGLVWLHAEYLRVRGSIQRQRGDHAAARADFAAALAVAREQGARLFIERAAEACNGSSAAA